MTDSRANTRYNQPQYNSTAPVRTAGIGVCPQPAVYQQKPVYPQQYVYQQQPVYPQQYVYQQQRGQDIQRIRDWLCWSIVNLIFGWGLLGFIPLIFSIICRSKKKSNDYARAKTMSTLALVFNILVTIGGLIGWIVFIVLMVLYVRMHR